MCMRLLHSESESRKAKALTVLLLLLWSRRARRACLSEDPELGAERREMGGIAPRKQAKQGEKAEKH